MKKRWISSIVIIIALLTALIIYWFCFKETKIVVSNWNGMEKRYVICELPAREIYTDFDECRTFFKTGKDIEKYLSENKDFIRDITYYEDPGEYPAKLFYSDNNYFILSYDSYNDGYDVKNCYSRYRYSDSIVYLPTPMDLPLEEECMKMSYNNGYDIVKLFFERFSFESAKEFYGRLDDEYVQIDEKAKRISVAGYDVYSHETITGCLTYDFENKIIIGLDENNEEIIIDGK